MFEYEDEPKCQHPNLAHRPLNSRAPLVDVCPDCDQNVKQENLILIKDLLEKGHE